MADKEDHRELLKRAVAAVQDLRSRLHAEEQKSREPIAIIGMGCRFPAGADSPDAFWRLFDQGIDAVSEIPPDRFPIDSYYDPNPDVPGKIATRRGAFLNEIDKFDADFFGISPREATQMDPQQRMLLEVSWEALEDGGQPLDRLARSSTGVFVGAITTDYMWRQLEDPDCIDAYSGTGTHSSVLSGRISYFLDLRGPSLTLDTACSSSLVAVHLACQSLRQHECAMALAGGVNLVTSPVSLMAYSRMGLLAPDGICKTFDSRADGFVGGEGCGVVVLKRLSDAVADGDSIRAVIRGSAVNQDGKSSTLTAPNGPSQEDVVARALSNAGISADRVTYVEAHGTGTALGDPIELEALKAVLDVGANAPRCAVGSAKTNIGHLGAAAGIAGLLKVVLALQHRTIPSHLHFRRLNPHVSLDDSRLFVPVDRLDWADPGGPLTAGVSSFGWSGTNAHVILEAGPAYERLPAQNSNSADMHLLPLSARSPEALEALARAYSRTLSRNEFDSPALLRDVCYTAGVRRTHHKNRIAVVGESAKQLIEELNQIDWERPGEDLLRLGVAFVFCGQGAQWPGMGRELYEREEVFRTSFDEIDAAIRRKAGWSILEKVELDNTKFAQPAIFALQVALARLWQSWGIEPSAVVGHSVGEIAAAHISGVLSLEDAVTVALSRAARMEASTGKGAMAEVELGPAEAARMVAEFPKLTIAAYNSPSSVVLAGEPSGLEATMQKLESRGIRCTRLHVKYAFHSSQMEPYVEPLIRDLQDLKRRPASLPVYSTVSGSAASKDDFGAQYWGRNIRQPVLFAEAIGNMIGEGYRMFLELGPHSVLSAAILNSLESRNASGATVASLHRKRSERGSMLGALGTLYCAGANVSFKNVTSGGSDFQPLPAYPWRRKRYWLEVASVRATSREQPTAIGSYEIVWERLQAGPASQLDAAVRRSNWILFEDLSNQTRSLSGALSKRIGETGAFCTLAAYGSDLKATLNEKSGEWNILFVCPESAAPASAIRLTEDTLVLAQSCLDARQKIRLWTVTRGAQPANGGSDRTGLAHAPILGLGRVLAIEFHEIWGGIIDVAPGPEDHCNSILAWITSNGPENEFAINGSGTYVPRLSESAAAADGARLVVHPNKSYLITGGLGGVGIAIARALVAGGARHLMLFGRGAPSEAATAAVKEMENLGASCTLRRGDVTVRRDVSEAFSIFGDSLPELAGVVHAAGVVRDALIPSITQEQLNSVLSPKVVGAWNLHEVAGDRPLDFFVMFSSLSSVLGSAGQASYCAANAFLDRLAYHRQALGLRGLTINWGPWADTGMTSRLSEAVRARWADQGITPFSPSQGAEMFMQLAGTRASQRAAVIMDWDRFRGFRTDVPPIIRNLGGTARPKDSAALIKSALDQFRQTATGEREEWMSGWVRRKVARILKTEERELVFERNLLEMGFDSLMVMELLRALGREFQIRTYPREFYERPSIKAFAAYLSGEIEPQAAVLPPPMVSQSNDAAVARKPGRAGSRLETPVVFLLSAPRSGSTLLRVMLAGHPHLFCPPELHLLGFTTMGTRKAGLRGSYLEEGLVRAIQELNGGSAEEAISLEQEWVSAELPVEGVYDRLQKMAKGRLLIDKSPSYAASLDTLKNAEELFASAKYIHLVRHPLSVIDSFVKNRFDRLLGLTGKAPRDEAERVWVESNANLLEFLRMVVDPGRSTTIRYEDLVRSPEGVMEDLCSFLGVPFDKAVLQPYEGRRMTDGLRAQSIGIGDPGFLEHTGIDASLADAWQNATDAASLGQEARTIAAGFRYDLPPSRVANTSMTEQYIDVRGLSLCLCSWGSPEGRPVFIIHGVLDHGAAWDEVAISLANRGFRVFAPDLRGHGRSQHAGTDGSYHLMDLLADVDTLLRRVPATPVTLVGHSMGASIAAMMAAARPDVVSRLVLVEPILNFDGNHRSSSEALSAHLNALETETKPQTFPNAGVAAERLREFYPSMDGARAVKMAARLVVPCPDGVRWRWDERIRSRAGLAYHGTFDLDAKRFLSILNEVQVPVTLVLGTDSELISREQAARQLGELRDGREVILRGGHNLHIDCPGELADVIGS